MTIRTYEVTVVVCDECEESIEAKFSTDYNVSENEMYWFDDLKDKGWTYHKDYDKHYCPECNKLFDKEEGK